MNAPLCFAEGYFLSSKGDIASVVNVLKDDSTIYRFTGTAKKLIEKIYTKTNHQEMLMELAALHPNQDPKANEVFLNKFLSDLKELGVLYSIENG